jgi:hypothetical protein
VVPEKEQAYPEPGMLGTLPAHGFYFRHVKRLEMSHVEIEPSAPDARPAIYTTTCIARTSSPLRRPARRRRSRSIIRRTFA